MEIRGLLLGHNILGYTGEVRVVFPGYWVKLTCESTGPSDEKITMCHRQPYRRASIHHLGTIFANREGFSGSCKSSLSSYFP